MPIRRDGEGKISVGPSWETLSERLIREAMERGEFDDLPYRGERLPLADDFGAGDERLAFHVLRNAGVAPPWIEADKEARRQLEARDRLLERAPITHTPAGRAQLRRALTQIVTAANAAIEQLNAEAPSPRQHRRPLRIEAELAELERRLRTG